jgi:hypothetical protein
LTESTLSTGGDISLLSCVGTEPRSAVPDTCPSSGWPWDSLECCV